MCKVTFEVKGNGNCWFFLTKIVDGKSLYTKKRWRWEEDAEEACAKENNNPNPRLKWTA